MQRTRPQHLSMPRSAPSSGAAKERFQKKAGSARCHGSQVAAAGSAAATSYLGEGKGRQQGRRGASGLPCSMQVERNDHRQCLPPRRCPSRWWRNQCTPYMQSRCSAGVGRHLSSNMCSDRHPPLLAERAVATIRKVEGATVEAGVSARAQQLEEAAIVVGGGKHQQAEAVGQ